MKEITMDNKAILMKFVDAVIADDAATERLVFSEISGKKTQFILGLQPSEEAVVAEQFAGNNRINIEGNTIVVDGKPVGTMEYDETDTLYFTDLNGKKHLIDDNGSPQEFMRFIKDNYLGDGNE